MIRGKVRNWVEHQALLPWGANIIAACSGGPDSLTLVDLLDAFQHSFKISLFVAHFDHGLRGEDSRRDAEFVRLFCERKGLPFFSGCADVMGEVKRRGGSIEEVSRLLRYSYLRQVAKKVGGALIATGHHRDDQAETLLLNLIRGSGGRGLGAMRPRQGDIVRPLLCLTRAEIETYCRDRNLQPRFDATNDDVEFRRNRVRQELVPLLQHEFNPSLTDTLCRTADILAEDHDFLRSYVEMRLPEWVLRSHGGYQLDAGVFLQLHVAVQRELLLNLLRKLRGDIRGIAFSHVEQMRELFRLERGTRSIKLPGPWRARKSYQDCFIESILITKTDTVDLENQETSMTLSCPGETILSNYGIVCRCSVSSGALPQPDDLGPHKTAFDCADLQFPLTVRRRRRGDCFQPLGAPGTRKLKKILIDMKIPVELRDSLPIICDSAGILWVVGCRRSQRGRLSEYTSNYIMVEIIKMENTQ